MEKLSCSSCGGSLEKYGPTELRCRFCGTIHQLDLGDTDSVRSLVELNNQRWIHINRLMDAFFNTVNQAATHQYNLRKPKAGMLMVSGFFVFVLLGLGAAFYDYLEEGGSLADWKGLTPFLVIVGIALIMNGYYYLLLYIVKKRFREKVESADEILAEVARHYREMSNNPLRDLINQLHDHSKVTDPKALDIARQVYGRAIEADAAASGVPPLPANR